IPTASWPSTRPFFMPGTVPRTKCRSVPQIALAVMRTIASVGSLIFGSATFSSLMSPMPWNTTAFIAPLLRWWSRVRLLHRDALRRELLEDRRGIRVALPERRRQLLLLLRPERGRQRGHVRVHDGVDHPRT